MSPPHKKKTPEERLDVVEETVTQLQSNDRDLVQEFEALVQRIEAVERTQGAHDHTIMSHESALTLQARFNEATIRLEDRDQTRRDAADKASEDLQGLGQRVAALEALIKGLDGSGPSMSKQQVAGLGALGTFVTIIAMKLAELLHLIPATPTP